MKILVGITDCIDHIIQENSKDVIEKIVWVEKKNNSSDSRNLCQGTSLAQEEMFCEQYFQNYRKECINRTEYYREFMLEHIHSVMNEYHGVHYNCEQWKLLLDYWLEKLIVSFYDKYIKIKKVIDIYGIGNIGIVTLKDEAYYVPKEIVDFLVTARENDGFCMRQYTDLADWFGIQSLAVCEGTKDDDNTALVANVAAKEKTKPAKDCRVFLYKSYLPKQAIEEAVKLTDAAVWTYPEIPLNYIYWTMKNVQAKYTDREKLNHSLHEKDDFLNFFAGIWGKYMPVSYLEGFPALCRMAESYFDVSPKVVISAPAGVTHDDVFKAFLMLNEGKINIYDVQHGGNYGVIDQINAGERSVSKKFYTFGWREEKYQAECVPMPSVIGIPYLKLDDAGRPNHRYLYTAFQPYKYRIDFAESYTLNELEQDETAFFGALDSDVINRIIVRNYANFRDALNRFDFYRSTYPTVTLRNHLPFRKELASAALMVAPSLDTTYLEAMWMNKPLIIFYSDRLYTPTSHAKKFLGALKEAGVLYDSPRSAAEKLNEIKGAETDWWMEKARQEAVEEFKRQYAFLPNDSIKRWEHELIRLCEEAV